MWKTYQLRLQEVQEAVNTSDMKVLKLEAEFSKVEKELVQAECKKSLAVSEAREVLRAKRSIILTWSSNVLPQRGFLRMI